MSNQTYPIATVADFLTVPKERRAQCLREFAMFLEMLDDCVALMGATATEGTQFIWTDDGKEQLTGVTFTVTDPTTGEQNVLARIDVEALGGSERDNKVTECPRCDGDGVIQSLNVPCHECGADELKELQRKVIEALWYVDTYAEGHTDSELTPAAREARRQLALVADILRSVDDKCQRCGGEGVIHTDCGNGDCIICVDSPVAIPCPECGGKG